MLGITLYTFAKKENSTKRPDSSLPHLDVSVNINDDMSSILAPTLRMHFPENQNLYQYNYVYIPSFSRYYYIQNWEYNADGTWSARCTVDVLASWRLQIRNSGGYVGRDSIHVSWDIPDPLYPPTSEFVCLNDWYPTGLSSDINNGSFILGVISEKSPNIGAAKYYLVTKSNLTTLMQNMVSVSNPVWGDVDTFSSDVLKSLINPMQFIVSCKWFPCAISVSGVSSEQISLWGWNTGAYGYPIPATYITMPPTSNASGWWHLLLRDLNAIYPQGSFNRFDWPYFAPYAEYNLITAWGTFELDPNVMHRIYTEQVVSPKLDYKILINLVSGTGTLIVTADLSQSAIASGEEERYEFFRREIEIGLDIPLAQVSLNYLSVAKASLSAAGKSADVAKWMFNPVGNFTDIASDVMDATAASVSPTSQTSSTATAAFTPLIERIQFQMKRHKTIPRDTAVAGNVYKHPITSMTEDGLGSFVQMDISTFEAPCTDIERDRVIAYLKGGFYNE